MINGERIYRENLRRILLDIQFFLLFEGLKKSLFESREAQSAVAIKRQIIELLTLELAKEGLDVRSCDANSIF